MSTSSPGPREGAETVTTDFLKAFGQAVALEKAGRLQDAERLYRQLLAQTREGAGPILHNLALMMRGQGRLAEAESSVRQAIAADPDKPAFHNTLAVLLRSLGRWDEADSAYRQALKLWPGYPEAHFNLGLLHELRGRRDDAIVELREALRLKPDYAQARFRLAGLLQRGGFAQEALAELEGAGPAADSFEALYHRGGALTALRRHDEAIAALERARTQRPDSLEATLAMAAALREAGRNDEALAAYWRALELRPDRLATHDELNRLAWTSGRHDLYLRSFAYVRERRGPDAELLLLEAAFHMRRDKFAEAERLLREARELAPGRGDVAGLLARALAGQGRFEESYPLFVEAINVTPAATLHRIEFAFALLRDRQPREALAVLDQALRVAPFDQLVLAALSLAYRELEDSRYHALVDFSRYVRIYDLQGPPDARDTARFNEALAKELESLHTVKLEPIEQTLRGGTQSTGRLFDERLPMVQHLRERVEAAVADYTKQLDPKMLHPVAMRGTAKMRFAGSWSCRLASGGYHNNHVHPQGWLSSAYYVRLPEQVQDEAHRPGWLKFGESNLALGARDAPGQAVKPVVGRLVLFPSFFWHGTVPFTDGGDRLAVAFDVTPLAAPAAAPLPAEEEISPMVLS